MNGLSTLNRLLGKRNKDVSKSTSNLSRSTTNLDASSHMTTRVIQLPVVANTPFEQTFRVTVLLPRDQLYVARVGAKTKLSALLEMVCSDKLLDAQKYVFRHPVDFQQGFELDMNIGEVGLSEIRLISRKELEALRNSDYRLSTSDIFRMHQKSARETSGGTSVSSSDMSRTSKLVLKTTSPYSSTNSLNSMDSSGVSSSSRGGGSGRNGGPSSGKVGNGHGQLGPPVAPTRKKRLAPRPPSQNSISEVRLQEQMPHANGTSEKLSPVDHIFKEPQLPPYSRQNFHVSTPNLYDRELKSVDSINNNTSTNGNADAKFANGNRNGYSTDIHNNSHRVTQTMMLEEEDRQNLINTKTSFNSLKNRPTSMYIIREPESNSLERSIDNGGSMMDIHHSRASSSCSDAKDPRDFQDMPEPTPRKRLNSSAKKSKAPAPPPRAKTAITPVPTPSPRALTRSTLDLLRDHDTTISETDSNFSSEPDDTQRNRVSRLNAVNGSVHRAPHMSQQNVSKVMLNVEQIPLNDPIVTSTTPDSGEKKHQKNGSTSSVSIKIVGNDTSEQQQNLSSPSTPIVSKVQIGGKQMATMEHPTSPVDNSSDEEIKIYNIESGKTMIKKKSAPEGEPVKQNKDVSATPTGTKLGPSLDIESKAHRTVPNRDNQVDEQQTNGGADEEQWTYQLPAPPKFADSSIKTSDYDERGQFYRPASTFVDNTTLRSDMLTVMSDEPMERIEPFIHERLQTMLELTADRKLLDVPFYPSPPGHRAESPLSTATDTDRITHVSEHVPHISSDVEDGYRVGNGRSEAVPTDRPDSTQEAREVWLQTLEKRREKIIEGELETLRESIGVTQTTGSVVARSQSVNDRKSSVMSELNQLLREGVELSRKEEAEIAVVNRSNLANFKISTYNSTENKENIITTSTNATNSVLIEQQEQQSRELSYEKTIDATPVAKCQEMFEANGNFNDKVQTDVTAHRKMSVDSITPRKPHSLTQSSDEDDATGRQVNGYSVQGSSAKKEVAPVKRRSLTMQNKSPRVINRSDSFHSTRSDYIQSLNSPAQAGTSGAGPLHLTPRSTSYISLIGAQRWENRAASGGLLFGGASSFSRRKSTSELSICDSPSLQSLEVIKNILNTSRKSSINNLHQYNGGAVEDSSLNEIVLPSMAAIKRNSFTDISTLSQLNGAKAQLNGTSCGVLGSAVRKDSIEEAKIEQEPEMEQEPEKPQQKMEDVKEIERIVEISAAKIIKEPEESAERLNTEKQQQVEVHTKVEEADWKPKSETASYMISESKSDDEKLQNKQQHQHHAVKEPQTTVVNITTTSTVVSSSASNTSDVSAVVTPVNESDTKKWTYQGPPTISFATWNERPKIDVSIKSDRDYRFGGSSTLPRGFRNVNSVKSTKISIGPGGNSTSTVESSVGYVRQTIHEVDQLQPQKEEEVAVNVPSGASQEQQQDTTETKLAANPPKPATVSASTTAPGERLPIVRAVEYKKNITQRQPPPPVEPKPSYIYEAFSRNGPNMSPGTNVSSVSINGSALSVGSTSISRLSFGPKPPSVLQPTVRGFKSLDIESNTSGSGMPRLRPVSMIDTGTLRKTIDMPSLATASQEAPHSLPFSQHTLRRTGLKDKILAKEDPVTTSADTVVKANVSVSGTIPAAPVVPVSVPTASNVPPPPAPMPSLAKPSQPVVRGAIVKKSPVNTPAIDTRTALLDAIRNFNKDSLRK
ncbi:uncharacterized protein LOC128731749 [Anopheles nili]|uniref:uncharacterized protein LOC128731749 n=1 Tax=Anopheles nili TaxID=185578 RepID=UPI00237A5501|nr:uncharacterized protein LOC128731749 [Anopheles nili]